MDYMIFKTRKEAQAEADKFMGWDDYFPRPSRVEGVRGGYVLRLTHILNPDSDRYLRSDGFIR